MAAPLLRTFAIRPERFAHTTHRSSSTLPKEARVLPSAAIAIAILGTVTYLLAPSSKSSTLNETTFVPYTITARDAISPSSVLCTLSPHHHDPSPPHLRPRSTRWKYPLWSVEFKQPQVQIARHYTPLPPQPDEDPRDGNLRFYVRAVAGGEMSNYLSRLRPGDDVYLRGPHPGFDILGRLGACKNVVFLAGGTGVVPGMQVAAAVLEEDDSSQVKLLWAVRTREEVQRVAMTRQQPWWRFWTTTRPLTGITTALENPSAVAKELMRLKARFGERLLIRLAVDEEHTQFTAKDVQSALGGCGKGPSSRAMVGRGCQFHDQLLHAQASEFEDQRATCQCGGEDGRPGKNLFMVSGPDGFVAHYAGEKRWLGGTLTQGPVGGLAGQLQRGDPSLAGEWLVLKL